MTKQEIEFRVHNIIERVLKKQPVEDDTVELKSEWIEPAQAARRLAAHANCARGIPILWIIGLDETRGLIGADMNEVSNWYNAIKSRFDEEICPNLDIYINVPYSDFGKTVTVVALLFETDRVPYVIKNDAGGKITREVPWREANSTDSAKRSDLIKILVPLQRNPIFEILGGSIVLTTLKPSNKKQFKLHLDLYITPRTNDLLVIPNHRCKANLLLPSTQTKTKISFDHIRLHAPIGFDFNSGRMGMDITNMKIVEKSLTIQSTPNEIVVRGPGTMILETEAEVEDIQDIDNINTIEAKVSIKHDAESETPVTLIPIFNRTETKDTGEDARWIINQ